MNFALIAKLFEETEGLTNITLTINGDQINIVKPAPIQEKERHYFKTGDIVIDLARPQWLIGKVLEMDFSTPNIFKIHVKFNNNDDIAYYTADGCYTEQDKPSLKRILT